jgi:hypothetical protein
MRFMILKKSLFILLPKRIAVGGAAHINVHGHGASIFKILAILYGVVATILQLFKVNLSATGKNLELYFALIDNLSYAICKFDSWPKKLFEFVGLLKQNGLPQVYPCLPFGL